MSRYSKIAKQLKKNYSYRTSRLYEDFGLHPQTVRKWVNDPQNPLPCINQRPLVVFSEDLREWLRDRDAERKTKLELQQCYCMACHNACTPAEEKVYVESFDSKVRIKGICPTCGSIMNKGLSKQKLELVHQYFETITLRDLHILGRAISCEKTHLETTVKSIPSEPVTNTHLYKPESLF